MTPRILTTTALVGLAFALVVPAAWGSEEPVRDHGDATDARLAAQPSPQVVIRDHGDATDAKLEARLSPLVIVRDHGDATDARLAAPPSPQVIIRDHGDAAAAKLAFQSQPQGFDARSDALNRMYGLGEYAKTTPQTQGFDARSDGLNRLYGLGKYASPVVAADRFRIDHSNVPVEVSATSSGRDLEWPAIGIGFGVGIVLLLGLGLVMKATHTRPFAH